MQFPKGKITTYLQRLILVCILFFSMFGYAQSDIPKKPSIETAVYDRAHLFDALEKQALEKKLLRYADSTSTQIVVVTIKTLKGEDIAMHATEWAHAWGIGQKGKDNGVLLLIAMEDRKVTIRTGYGVEHLLTDALSSRIIRNNITPAFKQGKYYHGVDQATSYMIYVLSGEYSEERDFSDKDSEFPIGLILFIVFVVLIIILSKGNNNDGNSGNRRGFLDSIILSGNGRGGSFGGGFGGFGGGGGSFGGGGFGGGFGGGGFGGGGASGGW